MDISVVQLDADGKAKLRFAYGLQKTGGLVRNGDLSVRDSLSPVYAEYWRPIGNGYRREESGGSYVMRVNSSTPAIYGAKQELNHLTPGSLYQYTAAVKLSSFTSGALFPLYMSVKSIGEPVIVPGMRVSSLSSTWQTYKYSLRLPSGLVSVEFGPYMEDFQGLVEIKDFSFTEIVVSGNFIGSGRVNGKYQLVQVVMRALLTTQGTDLLNPTHGGDLQTASGANFIAGDSGSSFSWLRGVVTKVESEIKQTQAASSGLASTERLSSLEVLESSFSDATGVWSAKFRLTSEANETITFEW